MRIVIKWIKGNPYLYEQHSFRDTSGKVKSPTRYIGRVTVPFMYYLGVLLNNITEPNAFSLDAYYDEEEAQRRDIERSQQERDRLAEVVDPTSYDAPADPEAGGDDLRPAPAASPEQIAPAPAPSTEDSELDAPAPDDASPPEPGQPDAPDHEAAEGT
jgi:hypothetical protein